MAEAIAALGAAASAIALMEFTIKLTYVITLAIKNSPKLQASFQRLSSEIQQSSLVLDHLRHTRQDTDLHDCEAFRSALQRYAVGLEKLQVIMNTVDPKHAASFHGRFGAWYKLRLKRRKVKAVLGEMDRNLSLLKLLAPR
jgi:hypothetical protein